MQGPVDLPGTAPYARTKRVFDTRFDANRPAAVMVVQRSSDIARAMRFAQRFGLQVAPRAGGHSYVGASAANGTLVLDLRPLHSVSYDARSRSVLVASGATLYDVKKHLAAGGRGIPTGTCPTVGAAGLALGGGLGVESRAHGLTADRLTEARLVLPDGRSITASAAQHSDIFWALRGGGGGNIGVVTALRFATHPAGEQGIFTLTFAGGAAVRVLTGWARWIRTTARSRWAGVHVDAAAAAAVVRAVTARSRAGLPGSALLDPLTGAVTDLAPGATAFPWRRHTASVQWYVGDSSYASARDWLAAAHRSVGPYSAGGYVNYLETGQPARRYYDTNLDRLARVRRTYDPQRRVHSGLAV